jgi:hypothetical protein
MIAADVGLVSWSEPINACDSRCFLSTRAAYQRFKSRHDLPPDRGLSPAARRCRCARSSLLHAGSDEVPLAEDVEERLTERRAEIRTVERELDVGVLECGPAKDDVRAEAARFTPFLPLATRQVMLKTVQIVFMIRPGDSRCVPTGC